ncbi:hypothetical protein [Pseudochelatococcus contaminans]|nr:hypothetical protein [Pseudochelatococcus contaminans]
MKRATGLFRWRAFLFQAGVFRHFVEMQKYSILLVLRAFFTQSGIRFA